jgi:hypothetical protein
MAGFLDTITSAFKDGEMPEVQVEVTLKQSSMIELFAGIFLTLVALMIAHKILSTIK